MTREKIRRLLDDERDRQEEKHGVLSCAHDVISDFEKLSVLTEEVGEVAKALNDKDAKGLRAELVQVAAVAAAWLESLEDA